MLSEIHTHGGNSTFTVEETNKFINKLHINKLSAPATDKSDITIEIHDINTGYEIVVGFSIKSKLGNPSTLLNASGSTRFIYRIDGLSESEIIRINSIETSHKIRDRFSEIQKSGGCISFHKMESQEFQNNLFMIDSHMPKIVAQMLLGFFLGEATACFDLIEYACKTVPVLGDNSFNCSEIIKTNFFAHKMKEFLCAIALGMRPSTPWSGMDEATGGYIIVKHDGEVLCYHIYNRNAFKGYLLNNTKFEGASSTRHQYGLLYNENGNTFIKLALQIRFL